VDLDAAVKMVRSIEIGLPVLSALGFQTPAQEDCADVARRCVQALQSTPKKMTAAKDPGKKAREAQSR
jgi:hypothetical protein